MQGYFEDSASIDYSLTQKYPFYCFMNSSWQNEFPMPAHWHYFVEVLYCTTGKGRIIINGYSHDLNCGQLLFMFPRDVHIINTIDHEPFEYVVFKLDPALIFDVPSDLFMFKHFRQVVAPVPPEYQCITELQGFDLEKFVTIHNLFLNRPYKFEWQIKAIVFDFIHAYSQFLRFNGYNMNGDTMANNDFSSISPVFDFIHSHYREAISAADAAEHCHLSYSYFSRQFKKITGISFTQYLNFIRISEAEKLLLDRKDTVTTIGYKVGFTDTSYFIRQFKALKKITPKQFLQLIKDDF